MENNNGKVVAIVSHLFLIGWLVAFVMNQSNKTTFGSFYIRQTLGLFLLSMVSFTPPPICPVGFPV